MKLDKLNLITKSQYQFQNCKEVERLNKALQSDKTLTIVRLMALLEEVRAIRSSATIEIMDSDYGNYVHINCKPIKGERSLGYVVTIVVEPNKINPIVNTFGVHDSFLGFISGRGLVPYQDYRNSLHAYEKAGWAIHTVHSSKLTPMQEHIICWLAGDTLRKRNDTIIFFKQLRALVGDECPYDAIGGFLNELDKIT